MTTLPRALAPWAEDLARFAPELAVTLGEWARRIAPAVGTLRGRLAGAGEPDGVSGLARRGTYERLLLTEWLLADELPDEFVRRAAAGEHVFLERARREPASGRRSVALLDAGPEQLGAPRLAQLAVLVVLAVRARAAGIALQWGVVQHPGRGLTEGFSPELCRRFLEARTHAPASAVSPEAWRDALGQPAPADDLWLVGGPALARWGPGASSRLIVEEVADPAVRQLRLSVEAPAGRRELLLELPGPRTCVRLFRDPFPEGPAPPHRPLGALEPGAGLLFNPSGRRLVARLRGGGLVELSVPNSPTAPAAPFRWLELDPRVVALGWSGSPAVPYVVVCTDGAVTIGPAHDRRRWRPHAPLSGGPSPDPSPPGHLPQPCLLWPGGSHARFLDGGGALFEAHDGGRDGTAWYRALDRDVSALAHGRWLAYVKHAPPRTTLVRMGRDGRLARTDLGPASIRAFLRPLDGQELVAGLERPDGLWSLSLLREDGSDASTRSLRPPPGTEVVGVTFWHGAPALVLLEQDRRAFSVAARNRVETLLHTEEPVGAAAVSSIGDLGFTSARSVVVYSVARGAKVLAVRVGGTP